LKDATTSNDEYTCILSELQASTAAAVTINHLSKCLLELACKHNLTNACMNDIIRIIKVSDSAEVGLLPLNFEKLEEETLCDQLKMKLVFKCLKCKKTTSSTFSVRGTANLPRCCNRRFSYNDEHAVMFDPFQLLSLVLPTVWRSRNEGYLSPRQQELYQELKFSFSTDFSVTLNLDGVPIFTGSKRSMWPILGYIDGCSAKDTKSNIIVFGVWMAGKGANKPECDTLLNPIVDAFNRMSTVGLKWKTLSGDIMVSKAFVSRGLCDSMARPPVQGLMQFNAEYGCGFCEHKQTKHYFTHTKELSTLRTNANHRDLCSHTRFDKMTIDETKGIKRASVFLKLPYFDIIQGNIILICVIIYFLLYIHKEDIFLF
jgi:hypothetical protein